MVSRITITPATTIGSSRVKKLIAAFFSSPSKKFGVREKIKCQEPDVLKDGTYGSEARCQVLRTFQFLVNVVDVKFYLPEYALCLLNLEKSFFNILDCVILSFL